MSSESQSIPPLPDEKRIRRNQVVVVVIGIVVLSALVIYAYYKSIPPENLYKVKEKEVVTRKIENPAPVDERELWRAHSQKELLRLTRENKKLTGELDQLKTKVDALSKDNQDRSYSTNPNDKPIPQIQLPPAPETSAGEPTIFPPPPGLVTSGQSLSTMESGSSTPASQRKPSPQTSGSDGFFVLEVGTAEESTSAEGKKNIVKTVDNYLPSGTYIKTRLLSGLDAPTGGQAQKDPVPFLLRLTDNGQLPNGFRSHVKHCFVTLAGYGNISDSRAYGRTERLSCVLKDKTIFDANIKAWVSGEDGKAGLHGEIRNKRGQLIAYSLLSGLGGGFGEALAQSFTTISTNPVGSTSTVDPDEIGKFGLAQGFGSALDRISRWYLDRANEIYPVIEINAGRTPEIVLLEGLDFNASIKSKKTYRPLVTVANRQQPGILEVK